MVDGRRTKWYLKRNDFKSVRCYLFSISPVFKIVRHTHEKSGKVLGETEMDEEFLDIKMIDYKKTNVI